MTSSPQPPLFESTIAAIATPPGQGAVAIIRLSGPNAWSIAQKCFQPASPHKALQEKQIAHGWIVRPQTQDILDEVILLPFKAPKSFTGEDIIEIHCHGGYLLSQEILQLCFEHGAQPAQAGEYTKRAFLNGKLDLSQAESIADLISARGQRLIQLASHNLKHHSLGQAIDEMSALLIQLQAKIVASVDFPDEVDEPDRSPLIESLNTLLIKASALKQAAQHSQIIREGLTVAILGLPNAGKSSLFNALLAQERAIVTPIAGTTRDIITEGLSIQGIPITLMDTAGLHEGGDTVETLGIARSWQAAQQAQAILYVYDASHGLTPDDDTLLTRLSDTLQGKPCQLVANKTDQLLEKTKQQLDPNHLQTAAHQGKGVTEIFRWLETQVHRQSPDEITLAIALNQRQSQCLVQFQQQIHHALETLKQPQLPIDVVTISLSEALYQLDALSGRDTTEEVLSEVFSQFCVGK